MYRLYTGELFTKYLQSMYRVFRWYLQLEPVTFPWCYMFVILLFSFEEDSCYEPADKLHESYDEFLQIF